MSHTHHIINGDTKDQAVSKDDIKELAENVKINTNPEWNYYSQRYFKKPLFFGRFLFFFGVPVFFIPVAYRMLFGWNQKYVSKLKPYKPEVKKTVAEIQKNLEIYKQSTTEDLSKKTPEDLISIVCPKTSNKLDCED